MKDKKYYTLYNQIRNHIIVGKYSAGEKLPSKRTMADLFGCSVITVAAAYELLEQEGYISARQRSGYYVCRIEGAIANEESKPALIRHLPADAPDSNDGLEHSLWFKTVRKVMSERGGELFTKSPNKGCAVLRNAISDYLNRYRGMLAQPEQIIIGSGAEQLYETVIKILGREKVYAVEDPCYEQIREVYSGLDVKLCPLTMGPDGILSREFAQKGFDVLHVTPFNSYPSGITASISKRWEYLSWAEKSRGYIVEDDFASEFFLPGHPIQSLYSLDVNNSVIYINTFSKSLSPSMRMGYMILPAKLLDAYERKLGAYSCSVPTFEQYVLAEFISGGHFERHLNRVRRRMKE